MTYQEAHQYLLALPSFAHLGDPAYQPGLATMERLMDAMGAPHQAFKSIHVAGTNGKGSTASMVAAMASAAGYRTGLHTSPHLFSFTERMRLNGVPAPKAWIADAVQRFASTFEKVQPSFFEASAALAFLYFAEHQVDLAVVEVGMGGRLDATNVLYPELCIITHIGLDHTGHLGTTRTAIAREKAGIIKPGVPVVTAVRPAYVRAVLEAQAERQAAPFHDAIAETRIRRTRSMPTGVTMHVETPVRRYPDLHVSLAGRHQATNARLALRAVELALPTLTETTIRQGMAKISTRSGLRGRCEVLQSLPVIVADAAHNADGLQTALAFMDQWPKPTGQLFVVFGTLRDKAVTDMMHLLAEAEAIVLPVAIPGPRGLTMEVLHQHLDGHHIPRVPVDDVPAAVNWFQMHARTADRLLVTGSHRVLGALPQCLFAADAE